MGVISKSGEFRKILGVVMGVNREAVPQKEDSVPVAGLAWGIRFRERIILPRGLPRFFRTKQGRAEDEADNKCWFHRIPDSVKAL
jgi:hypothetical protein